MDQMVERMLLGWAESFWQRLLSRRSSTPTSSRNPTAFQGRLGTLSLNGPCSASLLLTWLYRTAAVRVLVPVVVATPKPVNTSGKGIHQADEAWLAIWRQLTGTRRPSKVWLWQLLVIFKEIHNSGGVSSAWSILYTVGMEC